MRCAFARCAPMLEHGIEPSTASPLDACCACYTHTHRAKSVGTIAQSATMTLSHAVKHKGAIQHLFQGHNESIPDMGEGSYEISVDRFKRYEKEMNNLKLSLRLYLEGTSASLQGLSKVIETIVQMKLPSDPEQVTEVSSGFDASLSASREIIGEHLVATITQDCIEVLNTELQVYVEVTPLILRRKQTALDASHYAGIARACAMLALGRSEPIRRWEGFTLFHARTREAEGPPRQGEAGRRKAEAQQNEVRRGGASA